MAEQCIVCLEDLGSAEGRLPSPQPQQAPGKSTASEAGSVAVRPTPTLNNETSHSEHDDIDSLKVATDDDADNVAVIEICGHALHDFCLKAWAVKANSCPICRQSFNTVQVYDRIGGSLLSTYAVEDKKQVADFDAQDWLDQNPEADETPVPCPICNLADREEVLLLCDGCDAPYHTHCIGLDSVPRGAWFCMECADALAPELRNARPEAALGRLARRNEFFPRTQASMRRTRNRMRSDEWMGAWGQISERIYDAINLDLDAHDDDDDLESYRRAQQLREVERREYQRWQQRLNIADRLGARDVFARNIQSVVGQQLSAGNAGPSRQETREERQAWGAFERARDVEEPNVMRRAKRKSRSITGSPSEPANQPEERRLKRPRTRRVPVSLDIGTSSTPGASHSASPSLPGDVTSNPTAPLREAPSFLSSLLREVEVNPMLDDENIRSLFVDTRVVDPSSPGGSPPASSLNSPKALSTTPPPHTNGRSLSPALSLSSHIEPLYPPANYSPTQPNGHRRHDGEHRRQGSYGGGADNDVDHRHRAPPGTSPEIRQPRPQRRVVVPMRMEDASPTRASLPLELKENISTIVRGVLKPHWKSSELTAEQYATINRNVSHRLYEEVTELKSVSDETRPLWEKIAIREVDLALAELKP